MEIQQRISELQTRQLELRAIMSASDERAANTEYNDNERKLAELEGEQRIVEDCL